MAATKLVIAAVGAPPLAATPPAQGAGTGAAGAAGVTSFAPAAAAATDPFLMGVNCYAEVFLEVQDVALSGVNIDPKAVTVYPTTRVYGGVAVQKEFLTGKQLGAILSQSSQDFTKFHKDS